MEQNPISREGYDKLREELRQLEDVELPAITQAVADARSEGDLRENAEYHGQRERQGLMQARINALKAKLSTCYIVDKSTMPKGIVSFGTCVTVTDLNYDDTERYVFVGPGEEDYSSDPMKILTSSPLAQSMLGKKVGEIAEFEAPRGVQRYKITAIEET